MGLYNIHGAISESMRKLEKRRIRNRMYGAVGGRGNYLIFPPTRFYKEGFFKPFVVLVFRCRKIEQD